MSAKATGNSSAISVEALSEPSSSLGLILETEGPPSPNCKEVMRSLDLQEQKSKEQDSDYCPRHLLSGRRQQTAAKKEA